jgi:hypothetical protein
LEYIRLFLIFVTAFFKNINHSEGFYVHNMILKILYLKIFQSTRNIIFPFIVIIIFLCYMLNTYMTSANTIYEKYPPHTSSAQILNGKSLIPFWAKVNITPHSCNHLNTHCTHQYICSRPNCKIHLQECHQSLLLFFCTQCVSVRNLVDGKWNKSVILYTTYSHM